jgi:hypothetical protein
VSSFLDISVDAIANPRHSIDATNVVSKEQFDAKVAAAFENVAIVETPAADTQTLATLLGVTADKLGATAVGFPKGGV